VLCCKGRKKEGALGNHVHLGQVPRSRFPCRGLWKKRCDQPANANASANLSPQTHSIISHPRTSRPVAVLYFCVFICFSSSIIIITIPNQDLRHHVAFFSYP
jgi:hypothetical protein